MQLPGKPIQVPATPVVSHDEVLEVGRLKAEVMRQIVEEVVGSI
jgi:purine-nucleoside phosphorylase